MSEIFEIKKSKGLGRGLFATKLIKKGERILTFTGPIISFKKASQRPNNKLGCPLQISPQNYIDIKEPGVLANHSCSPNAGIKNDRFLVAIQDILPGQEIFYDYSTTMDEDYWTLECKCGSPNCRHIVKDFKYLPVTVQNKYLKLRIVQSFIMKKYQQTQTNKPITTLFLLISVDGKISTGNTDELDVDADFPKIKGIKEGLWQYYDIEKQTTLHFLITGAVMTKKSKSLDVNNRTDIPLKVPANCIIVDNSHLKESGIKYLAQKFNSLTVVTKNQSHPANNVKLKNLKVISYPKTIDFKNLFQKLKKDFKIKEITIQSGGTLNSILLREKLIDKLSIVVAPILIGGKDTPSLIDGESLSSVRELKQIKALELVSVKKMANSYLHLRYNVINDTVVN